MPTHVSEQVLEGGGAFTGKVFFRQPPLSTALPRLPGPSLDACLEHGCSLPGTSPTLPWAVPTLSSFPRTAFTFAAWVRVAAPVTANGTVDAPGVAGLLAFGSSGPTKQAVSFSVQESGGLTTSMATGKTYRTCTMAEPAVTDGAWHHVGFVYSAANASVT